MKEVRERDAEAVTRDDDVEGPQVVHGEPRGTPFHPLEETIMVHCGREAAARGPKGLEGKAFPKRRVEGKKAEHHRRQRERVLPQHARVTDVIDRD